ncbi:MAG: hypothetical protein J6W41_01210 [Alphaproteobacteria bacterium]|nr:hypothetical protein [Alphaproteobacteria bacterium]
MSFWEKYRLLNRQKKQARHDVDDKYGKIEKTEIELFQEPGAACVRKFLISSLGISSNFIDLGITRCEKFSGDEYCQNQDCEMCHANHEYIDAVKKYQGIKSEKIKLLKDIFSRKK